MDGELAAYLPILVFLAVVIGFVVVTLAMAHLIGPFRHNTVKQMPYESGMDPVGDARQPFDVKFYLVAVLFLVFDLELVFVYPWAVSAYVPVAEGGIPLEMRRSVFFVMVVFLVTLAIGYVYAWRKGVFRWR